MKDEAVPFLDMAFLFSKLETTASRDILQNQFTRNEKRIYLKLLSKLQSTIDTKYKIVNLYLNLHYMNPSMQNALPLLKVPCIDDKVKIFFKPVK